MVTGKSRADFPGAFIPFDKSVGPVPTVSITDAPTVSVCINEEWLPFVLGALKALARPETWNDTWENIQIAESEVNYLIGSFVDGCGSEVPQKGCFSGSFTDEDYKFVPSGVIGCDATWTDGTGWVACGPTGGDSKNVAIKRVFSAETFLTGYTFSYVAATPRVVNWAIDIYDHGTHVHNESGSDTLGGAATHGGSFGVTGDLIFFQVAYDDNTVADDLTLTDFQICYDGAFPLAENPSDVTFTHVSDFSGGQDGWTAQAGIYATWGGTEWTDVDVGGNSHVCAIQRSFPTRVITHVTVEYGATAVANGGTRGVCVNSAATVPTGCTTDLEAGLGNFITDVVLNETTGFLRINVDCAVNSGLTHISKVTIRGIGTDPF